MNASQLAMLLAATSEFYDCLGKITLAEARYPGLEQLPERLLQVIMAETGLDRAGDGGQGAGLVGECVASGEIKDIETAKELLQKIKRYLAGDISALYDR